MHLYLIILDPDEHLFSPLPTVAFQVLSKPFLLLKNIFSTYNSLLDGPDSPELFDLGM